MARNWEIGRTQRPRALNSLSKRIQTAGAELIAILIRAVRPWLGLGPEQEERCRLAALIVVTRPRAYDLEVWC